MQKLYGSTHCFDDTVVYALFMKKLNSWDGSDGERQC